MHLRAVLAEAAAAPEQAALAVRGGCGGAQHRFAAGALGAEPAARHEREDDVIPLADVRDAAPDRLDDAGGLVSERERHGPRPRPVDDRQVRVAQAGRADADQELAVARPGELELLDPQRLRLRVGPLEPELAQDRGARSHARNSSTRRLKRSGSSRKSRCPAPTKRSRRAPGMRRASSTPFSYGHDAVLVPVHDERGRGDLLDGPVLGEEARAGVVLRAPAVRWRRVLEPVAQQLLELLRVLVRPAGAEGERHRRARVLRRRLARIGEPRGVRLRRDRVVVGAARAGADEDEPLDEVRDGGARRSGRGSRPSRSPRRAPGGPRAPRRRRRPSPRSSTARAAWASGPCRGSRPRRSGSAATRPGAGAATTRSRSRGR